MISDQIVLCCLSPIFLLKVCLLKALRGLLSNLTGVRASRQRHIRDSLSGNPFGPWVSAKTFR